MDSIEKVNKLRLIADRKIQPDKSFIFQCLQERDHIVQEWAIVCSTVLKEKDEVKKELRSLFNKEIHHDIKFYVLRALSTLGVYLDIMTIFQTLDLSVTLDQKNLIYIILIDYPQKKQILKYLDERIKKIENVEEQNLIKKVIPHIMVNGMMNREIEKQYIKETYPEIYSATAEAKMEKIIKERFEEKAQQQLIIDENEVDIDELPEKVMKEIEEENYIQDLLFVNNRKIISKTVIIRDIVQAREYGKKNSCCEICGIGSIRLDVHHIKPLKYGGEDTIENMISVCPNCHRRFHDAKIIATKNKQFYKLNYKNLEAPVPFDINRDRKEKYNQINAFFNREFS